MNILICAVQFKGGSLQVVISLIKEFVKYPENNYYVVVSKEVKKQIENILFPDNFFFYDLPYPTKIRLINSFLRGSFLSKIEKETNANCVVCSSGPLYWKPNAPLLIGYNLAHHLYPESSYFSRIPLWMRWRWRLKWAVHKYCYHREASAIFVQTEDVNVRLKKALKFDEIYTISNTYNDAYNNPQKFPNKLQERAEDKFRLLTLSAFYKHKNFEIIPKVIDELRKRGEDGVKFIVTLSDDIYKDLFAESYRDKVINVGFVPTKEGASLYQECDVMFLPTLLECFSASYAEAMVMQKPIMTSDFGFAHTVCKDAAIYFDPDNAEDIAIKIIELKNNPQKQQELIQNGLKQMAQFGTAEKRAERILELCKQLS